MRSLLTFMNQSRVVSS